MNKFSKIARINKENSILSFSKNSSDAQVIDDFTSFNSIVEIQKAPLIIDDDLSEDSEQRGNQSANPSPMKTQISPKS